MQPNMMDFGSGPGGSMISGKWINKANGTVINVRDSFIDDSNNMIILTDKGQLSMDEFSKYYVQASDEIYNESGQVIDKKEADVEEIVTDLVADPIYPVQSPNQPILNKQKPQLNNFDLIDKIFKKSSWNGELKVKFDSTVDFPEQELKMLIEYFDVKIEDIANYIGNYLVNSDLLNKTISDYLNSIFDKKSTINIKKGTK